MAYKRPRKQGPLHEDENPPLAKLGEKYRLPTGSGHEEEFEVCEPQKGENFGCWVDVGYGEVFRTQFGKDEATSEWEQGWRPDFKLAWWNDTSNRLEVPE